MDLKMFFDPTSVDTDSSASSFQSNIYINSEKMPDHEGLDIALIGLNEYRGSQNKDPNSKSCDEVRKQLFALKKGFGDYGIIDLGNFRNGPQLEDTYLRLKEVCSYLMDKGIIPLLFGGSHDLLLGQFLAYESSGKLISMLNIDQHIDLEENGSPSRSHLNKIFGHNPNFLFNYSHLAYQSYLTNQKDLELIEQLSFDATRLGTVKENIQEIEPYVRDADMLSFDLSSLQSNYAPAAFDSKAYGLTGEEACQLCWYAGQNEKLSSFGIYN
jgi:formiminoglutamase